MSKEKQFEVFDPSTQSAEEQKKKHEEYIELLKKRLQGKKLMVAA